MVYVLNANGQPLMPTERYGKVRRMLESGKAKVVKRCPFTIQLNYETQNIVQPVSLGIDAGSRTIGSSATTEQKVLYEAEVTLRNDIVDLLATRREYRRARRNRKTRYRKYVFGYQLFDKVLYKGTECFVFGRRSSGSFDIRKLDGEKVSAGVSYKKITPLEKRKTILTERRTALPPHA